MNLDKVEFYNVGDLEAIPGIGENGLVRVPMKVRNLLNEKARYVGMDSIGTEIRYVTDATNIDIYISMQKSESIGNGTIRIYKGNFLYQTLSIQPGITNFFRVTPPPNFQVVNDTMLNQGGFSPNVWRIVCNRSTIVIHGIDTHGHEIRPPKKEELPSLNWIAYGSSITNSHLDGYVHVAASRLKMQVQNMGFSGCCHIEKELVDYMVKERSFDFITCELGVNMLQNYTPDEFNERVSYLISSLKQINKPAIIITPFPHRKSMEYTALIDVYSERNSEFNRILVDQVNSANSEKIHVIQGSDILDDLNGLSGDLTHPTTYGHAIMGINLANYIKKILEL